MYLEKNFLSLVVRGRSVCKFFGGGKVKKGSVHGVGKVITYVIGFLLVITAACVLAYISNDEGKWTMPALMQSKNLQTLKVAKKDDLLICIGLKTEGRPTLHWAVLVQENKNGNPVGITLDERSVELVVTEHGSSRTSIRDCEVKVVDTSLAYALVGEILTKGLKRTALPARLK